MLSVKQLIYYTHTHRRSILDKATQVNVKFSAVEEVMDDDGDSYREVSAVCVGDTIPRDVTLKFWGKGGDSKLWASCTCEYWLYHCEIAVKRKGSTDNLYAENRRPKVTNPNMIAHVCKHVVACIARGAANLKPTKKPAKPIRKKTGI